MGNEPEPTETDPLNALRAFDAARRAEFDQFMAAISDVARMQKAMFDAYLEAGFSRVDAWWLTALWLTARPSDDQGESE